MTEPSNVEAVDLHARVLAALDEERTAPPFTRLSGLDRVLYLRKLRALRAIAVRHAPTVTTWKGADVDNCATCGQGFWPCPDFRNVAAAVGVEVPE